MKFTKEIGCRLHTGMRKALDSTASAVVWRLIDMDAYTEAWKRYCKVLIEIKTGDWKDLKDCAELMRCIGHEPPLTPETRARCRTLALAMLLFTDNEWKALESFVEEYE